MSHVYVSPPHLDSSTVHLSPTTPSIVARQSTLSPAATSSSSSPSICLCPPDEQRGSATDALLFDGTSSSLLATPLTLLRSEAAQARSRSADAATARDHHATRASAQASTTRQQWVDVHAPHTFAQLLSDDRTNRTALAWILARGGKKAPPLPPSSSSGRGGRGLHPQDAKMPILLLAGPPGVGKTTLAHVIATHAGYRPVELNASDDRSAASLGSKVSAAIEHKTSVPNCLILDELDGTSGSEGAGGVGQLLKILKNRTVHRPIIATCNDKYAPVLRDLRQVCFIVDVHAPRRERLLGRLKAVLRSESFTCEDALLSALIDATAGDIRSCLHALEFACRPLGRGKRVTAAALAASSGITVGGGGGLRKEGATLSVFDLWNMVFEGDAERSSGRIAGRDRNALTLAADRTLQPTQGTTLASTKAALEWQRRWDILSEHTDDATFLHGLTDNYLAYRSSDPLLTKAHLAADTLAFNDANFSHAGQRFLAHSPMTLHRLAAGASAAFSSTRGRFTIPTAPKQLREQQARTTNVVSVCLDSLQGTIRPFHSQTTLLLDVASPLLTVLSPKVRTVSQQLLSAAERGDLQQLLDVHAAYGVRYRRDTDRTLVLDPPLERIAVYDPPAGTTERSDNPFAVAAVGLRRVLTTQQRSYVSRELRSHRGASRKRAYDETNPSDFGGSPLKKRDAANASQRAYASLAASRVSAQLPQSPSAPASVKLRTSSSSPAEPAAQRPAAPTSAKGKWAAFFGAASRRALDRTASVASTSSSTTTVSTTTTTTTTATTSSQRAGGVSQAADIIARYPASSLRFTFNEGFSSAVRRPVPISDFYLDSGEAAVQPDDEG